jgi:hypothetical protein
MRYGLLILLAAVACTAGRRADTTLVEYADAVWWDGRALATGSRYVRGESFVEPGGALPGRVVDLEGAFVSAPFAEGHNHNLSEALFQAANLEYLSSGVFYVKIPNAHPPSIASIRESLARPDTVDAIFSMGGLSSPGGLVVRLFVNVLAEPIYGGATYEDFAGRAFHEVSNPEQVVAALETLEAHGADFVKATLFYAEDYAREGYDRSTARGLDPTLLPIIVQGARERGWTTTVHVQSAEDFRTAVASGCDEIAHVPGFWWPEDRSPEDHRLTREDAILAARSGTGVVTSTLIPKSEHGSELAGQIREVQRANLHTLIDSGVEIRVGSDLYDRQGTGEIAFPTRSEILNLVELGVFEPPEALARWIDTGRAIFPQRRIACFEPGCEASFLVFDGDPREDLSTLERIRLAVKQGVRLRLRPPAGDVEP